MRKRTIAFICIIVFCLVLLWGWYNSNVVGHPAADEAGQENNTDPVAEDEGDNYCRHFFSPFAEEEDRGKYLNIKNRLIDVFGAYRNRGHKHAGIDLKGDYGETVYPIGKGTVYGCLYAFPYLAVVIEHTLPDDTVVYSSYVHVAQIEVEEGMLVDENTPVARLFNEEEQQRAGYKKTHLHLEIRTTMEDNGVASYSCKTLEELEDYFLDPVQFLELHMTSE